MAKYDSNVRPQDDYFGYINNPWLKSNPIPPSESSWGAFYVLRDNASEAVHAIMKDLQTTPPDRPLSHDQGLMKTFFESALSYDSHRDEHHNYLTKLCHEIDTLSSLTDVARFIGAMHRRGQSAFWDVYVDHDDKNSKVQVLRFHQAGLTLPNRDYYLDKTKHMKQIRDDYTAMHTQLSDHIPMIATDFTAVIALETALAKKSWSNIALRDIAKNYNPLTLKELDSRMPFDWTNYFDALGWQTPSDHIVVSQPSFLKAACSIIADTPLPDLKSYLKWHLLGGWGTWIDNTSTQILFDFFGVKINGTTEQKPLWKRAVQSAGSLIIGEVIGREYAAMHFPESSKKAVLDIVEDIRKAYHHRINSLQWMGDTTKLRAHTKLDNIKVFIGYPSVWKDLSQLTFSAGNHLALLKTAREFRTDIELAKIGQPPAEEDWQMNAHTVNAYHHPNRLEIVFPAAILQPPFFDPSASYATNLGGIGAVTGHEFTHGFDDQGADFDEHGNTFRWQTEDEREAFDTLAAIIVEQANSFETFPGTNLQGKLILGEAIADIGGLELATEALRNKYADQQTLYRAGKELFESFARCECAHTTDQRALELAKIDPHPPSRFRVNCVVCHNTLFYEVYKVKSSDSLFLPANLRAHIW